MPEPIRPVDLPAAVSVPADAAIMFDNGSVVQKGTPSQIADTARPFANQAEAEAGVDNSKTMTPLRTKQAIDSQIIGKAQAAALGVAGSENSMGSYSGGLLPDGQTAKQNIQTLETAVETAQADIITAQATADAKSQAAAIGIGATDTDMGNYTSPSVPDGQTAKQNIEAVASAVDGINANIAPGAYDSYPHPWLISPDVGSSSARLLSSTTLAGSGALAPSNVIEYTYDGDAAIALDFPGAPGGSVPGGLYVQHRQTGNNPANNAFTHSIMAYALNDAAGDNDVIAMSGRARKNDVTDGVGDAAGVWGSAYQYSTKAGLVMGAEATIYQNVAGSTARDRLDSGSIASSVALHLGSYSTGSPATAILAADGSGEGVWNYEIVDKNLFQGAGLAGTVAYNCGSWDGANFPEIGWKVGNSTWHIYRGNAAININANQQNLENTASNGSAGHRAKASGTGNAYYDVATGETIRGQYFWDGTNNRVVYGSVGSYDVALRTNETDRVVLTDDGNITLPAILDKNFAGQGAAIAGGVPANGVYHSDGALRVVSGTEYAADKEPIIVVAWGQSNMVGWTEANNGPLYLVENAQIWDRGAGALRPVDPSAYTYAVYCGNPGGVSITTMGNGRNSPAFAFAERIQQETGRPVIIVPNCTGARSIDFWIGSGTASVDWVALEEDLADVFALTGTSKVDYLIGQQGEADTGGAAGAYATKLQTFIAQVKGAAWWDARKSRMIFGEPCRSWTDTTALNYLLGELATVKAANIAGVSVANSYALAGGSVNNYQSSTTTDSIHFRGSGLFSIGYYNYWESLPQAATGKRDPVAGYYSSAPWGPNGSTKYPGPSLANSRSTHLATLPLYTLAPSITKVKKPDGTSRLFVGATVNINNAGESSGSHSRIVYSDDDGATWLGGTTGSSNGFGIVNTTAGANAASPMLWNAPDGSLWIFQTGSTGAGVFDSVAGVYLSVVRDPFFTANNQVWSKPVKVLPTGWPEKPEYLNGKWYLPVSYWNGTTAIEGRQNFIPALQGRHMYEIDWVNRTLTFAFTCGATIADRTFDEHCTVMAADGAFICSWRTNSGPYVAYSEDAGASWSTPVAFTGLGTVAGGTAPASKHRAINVRDGLILYAWNNAGDRTNLTVGLTSGVSSKTNFNPSGARQKVLTAGSASYPDIFCDGDTAYVVADDGYGPTVSRSLTKRVRLWKFSINDLRTIAGSMTVTETIVIPGT